MANQISQGDQYSIAMASKFNGAPVGIYAGTGTPAASLGDNGDVYIHYTD